MNRDRVVRDYQGSREDVYGLLGRVRSEFLEMPGLRLAPAQAARLWAVDRETSEQVLDRLVEAGFLLKRRDGSYLRVPMA
jgi:hypothetical protein